MMRRPNPPGIMQSTCPLTPNQILRAIQEDYPRSYMALDGAIRVLRGDDERPTKMKPIKARRGEVLEPETSEEVAERLARAVSQSVKSRDRDDNEIGIKIKVDNLFGYATYMLEAVMRVETANKRFNLVERYESIVPDATFVLGCMSRFEDRVAAMHKKLVVIQKDAEKAEAEQKASGQFQPPPQRFAQRSGPQRGPPQRGTRR